jgi:hypothetical protein
MQQVIDELALKSTHTILLFGGGKKEIELLNSLSKGKENVLLLQGNSSYGRNCNSSATWMLCFLWILEMPILLLCKG